METVAKRLYEAMFLIDSAQAAADWEGMLSVINNILQRADAEVVSMRKWQERKLAYNIGRNTRGTYILCYFKADSRRVSGIEKDVQLSEKVIRVLVLTTEKRPAEMIEKDINVPEEKVFGPPVVRNEPEKPTPAAASDTPSAPSDSVDAADSKEEEGDKVEKPTLVAASDGVAADDSKADEGDKAEAEEKEETAG